MKKQVWFILDVRYPTEKAYGVTTNFTAAAIQKSGNYNVTVVTSQLDDSFSSSVKSIEVKMPLDKVRKIGMRQNNIISKLTYSFWKYIYPLKLASKIKRKDCLLWLRDIRMSLIFCLLGYKVVCEIHRTPSIFSKAEFKILNRMPNVTFAVISEDMKIKLKIKKTRSVIAGMSVNEKELMQKAKNKNENKFVVGYIGSAHSSGNRLSIDVILKAATVLEKTDPKVQFKFIGFKAIDINDINGHPYPQNLKFFGRLSRKNLFKELDTFNIGLAIYPDTKYFLDSFPIKIVEYASRRIPIVASNTRSHQRILGENKALFFDLNSSASLVESISRLISSKELACTLSQNGFDWVKSLTYENRAKNVLAIARF
jgi:glycosyltransferase involved in cell wall biosynthesis